MQFEIHPTFLGTSPFGPTPSFLYADIINGSPLIQTLVIVKFLGFLLSSLFKAVDADLVRQTCYNFVYDKCPVVAAVGPTENLTDYNRMRAGMYWLRV